MSCLAWYSVVCRSVLWEVISTTCRGAVFDMSGVGRVSGIGVIRRLFGFMLVLGVVIRLW